jgi:hypothetical protein
MRILYSQFASVFVHDFVEKILNESGSRCPKKALRNKARSLKTKYSSGQINSAWKNVFVFSAKGGPPQAEN